ncbi:SGNH/GDSL hydrolase family protein [Nesterenkonia aurantiaca]|uniref:GDSL-like lipase/acylhydrolase family protein n=1 Tax=Nesterenkonia aurantiaca TaxID=1436010 RepID=A0A4R7FV60_9MICC|nr:SGNH/GDSL hydrolase family protein [Nesterenkonia aurantiaca]TDS82643.1 GDSL-like lipase/acylhydrolase family protein [Nesterenkonia aurantiaca]
MSQKRRHRDTSPGWKYLSLILLALILGALVFLIAGPQRGAAEPTRVAVVGDSNTEMNSPDFAAGQIGDGSWASTVLSHGYRFAGGWAVAGSTSVQQAEGLEDVEGADVLLVMTGTNDLAQGVPFDQTAPSLDAIVAKAPADRVVVLAIPPRDQETTPSNSEFNHALQDLAEDRGWEFFDGHEFLRSPDGGFVEGTTTDGVHLTTGAQEQFGEAVVEYLGRDPAS